MADDLMKKHVREQELRSKAARMDGSTLLMNYRTEVSHLTKMKSGGAFGISIASTEQKIQVYETEIGNRMARNSSPKISVGQEWICTDEDYVEFGLIGRVTSVDKDDVVLKLPENNRVTWEDVETSKNLFFERYRRLL